MTRHTRRADTRTLVQPNPQKIFVLLFGLCIAALVALTARADDEELVVSHGYSFFGELKYPADFEHFEYVNPDAPKGGEISFAVLGTFDSMNPYTRNGDREVLSSIMYETLLLGTADELGQEYGLLAEKLEYPKDKSWVIFHMRPEARFSDGTPVTAHDVVFSFNLLLEQGLKSYATAVSKRVPKFEALDDHKVKFYFAEGISRRNLIDQVGGIPVWSKAWFEESGERLDEPRLETSPGSGPYMVHEIEVGRRAIYERNPDYWGNDLAINKGRNNFDFIRTEYFTDSTAAFEAFKAGTVTYRRERDPKVWSKSYDFPAVNQSWVVKKQLPNGIPPSMTGIVFNTGVEIFKLKPVREAIALMFNFEWKNDSLYSGLYAQQRSFSTGTKLEAKGLPEGEELAFLKSLETPVPEEIFTQEPWVPHKSNASSLRDRKSKARALDLLASVGYEVDSDGKLIGPDGKQLKVRFLLNTAAEATKKSVAENFVKNVSTLGIDIVLETVDDAQWEDRQRDRDYDLVYEGYPSLLGTGTGLLQRMGSEAASYSLFNPAGLANPLVDEIINKSLLTTSQAEEDMTVRALDRVLRDAFFLIPEGYAPDYWVATWDVFGHPETLPPFALGTLDFWWYDADKAQKLEEAGAL